MEEEKTFGDIVRETRERLKAGNPEFSLRRFAARVGITPSFLSKIETNEFLPPRAEKVMKIAEALGLDPDEMLSKASRVAPDVKAIVEKSKPEMAEFLRTTEGLSSEQWREMIKVAKKMKGEGDGRKDQKTDH